MDDEAWEGMNKPKVEREFDGGPVTTGDPVIDKLERELWEKMQGG